MSQDKFLETFNLASETIAKNYLDGTIPFLAAHLPTLLKQIDSAEEKINENWGNDFSIFEETVKEWKELFLKAIFKFQQAGIISEKKKSEPLKIIPQKTSSNIFDIMREGQNDQRNNV